MTALGMLCPDCHAEVLPDRSGCAVCSPGPLEVEAPLWVRGRWVPATLDQIELTLEGSQERATVSLGWVHRNLGEQYGHDLYLKGQTRFACNPGFWQALSTRAYAD